MCPTRVHNSIAWSPVNPVLTDKEWRAAWKDVEVSRLKPTQACKADSAVAVKSPTSGSLSHNLALTCSDTEFKMDCEIPSDLLCTKSTGPTSLQPEAPDFDTGTSELMFHSAGHHLSH